MKLQDIRLRDPFIFPYEGKYYMYGTGRPNVEDINAGRQFWCYTSTDLQTWSVPVCVYKADEDFWATHNFWAPEVYAYNGKFYMLASFIAEEKNRATQALVAESPLGPFKVCGKPLTPENWMCLDGTLYIEDGKPYLVFCHEWVQVRDGEIAFCPLKDDLSAADGEPTILFKASESGWAEQIFHKGKTGVVTDGPFLFHDGTSLTMFWSSFFKGAYAVGMAESASGKLAGPWMHKKDLLFDKDGGHGMVFRDFSGQLYYCLHRPNFAPKERPRFFQMLKTEQGFRIGREISNYDE